MFAVTPLLSAFAYLISIYSLYHANMTLNRHWGEVFVPDLIDFYMRGVGVAVTLPAISLIVMAIGCPTNGALADFAFAGCALLAMSMIVLIGIEVRRFKGLFNERRVFDAIAEVMEA